MNPREQLYKTWRHMKRRCYDLKDNRYKNYGGRGIRVCDSWMKFDNFFKDMSSTYKKGLTIDRINTNGNYELINCRWATMKEQMENRTDNHWLEYKGIRDTLANWAKYLEMNTTTLLMRLNYYGWSIEKALTIRGGKSYQS